MIATVFVAAVSGTCSASGKERPSHLAPIAGRRIAEGAHPLPPPGLRAIAPADSDLYSQRAKRRIQEFLQMRLLELRAEGLREAACVVERRLPVSTLFEEDGVPAPYF